MVARVRVELKTLGMRELVNKDSVRRHLERRGRRVLRSAQADAPVDSGDFKESLHLISTTTDRVAVRVGSDDPAALIIEAQHGTLARALPAARGVL